MYNIMDGKVLQSSNWLRCFWYHELSWVQKQFRQFWKTLHLHRFWELADDSVFLLLSLYFEIHNGNLLKTLSTFLWSQTSYDVLPLQMATAIKTTSHCFKTQTLKLNIIFLIFTPCSCTDTKETMFCYLKPRGVQTVENMGLNNPYSYFLWV